MNSPSDKKPKNNPLLPERNLLQDLLGNIPDAIYFKDTQGKFEKINQVEATLLGIKDPHEAIGKTDFDFFEKETAESCWIDDQKVLAGTPVINREEVLKNLSDQPEKYVTASKVPIRDMEGNVVGLVGISRDITEWKRQESLYRKLIENMNEAVWMGDKNERTVYANPKFCELMEYTLEEMIGRESYDFWDEESARRVRTVNDADRKKGLSSSYEGNLKTKTGKLIPVLLNGTPLPEGGTIGIMTDLRSIKHQETLYKKLVRNMNEALWMGNEKGETLYANPKFCEISGYTLEEIKEKNAFHLWNETRFVKQKAYQREIPTSEEGYLVTKSKKIVSILLSGSALPDGTIIRIFTDLTEKQVLKKANKKLQELAQMRREFVSIASHQLRTPLSAIRWFLEMLLEGEAGKLNDDQQQLVEQVLQSNSRMIALVNDLLNVSRIESGTLTLSYKETDLVKIVEQVLLDFDPLRKEKLQEIVLLKTEIPLFLTDTSLLSQVIQNLISNAIKYTPEKGKIQIKIEKKDTFVRFEIEDNGIGIPQDEQKKLFQKFFRSRNVQETEADGSGLGLYICSSIIELAGGKLEFSSKEGKGTKFWFLLPLTKK